MKKYKADRMAEVNGIKLHYAVAGEGRPVILLHGNGEDHDLFDTEIDQLVEAGYRVFAPDSRGHGVNEALEEYHYDDMAEDFFQLIKALNLDKPALYGHSDGGIIALLLELHHPGTLGIMAISGTNLSPAGLIPSFIEEYTKINEKNRDPLITLMLAEPQIDRPGADAPGKGVLGDRDDPDGQTDFPFQPPGGAAEQYFAALVQQHAFFDPESRMIFRQRKGTQRAAAQEGGRTDFPQGSGQADFPQPRAAAEGFLADRKQAFRQFGGNDGKIREGLWPHRRHREIMDGSRNHGVLASGIADKLHPAVPGRRVNRFSDCGIPHGAHPFSASPVVSESHFCQGQRNSCRQGK